MEITQQQFDQLVECARKIPLGDFLKMEYQIHACGCLGPKDGKPFCPCQMRQYLVQYRVKILAVIVPEVALTQLRQNLVRVLAGFENKLWIILVNLRSFDMLPFKNKQDIFEFVAKHLFTQGMRAVDATICRYRGPNGTCCAIGCLIPDQYYRPSMEGLTIAELIEQDVSFTSFKKFMELLATLQHVHDADTLWHNSDIMREALRNVARRFKLKMSFLRHLNFEDR